jgi:hypothetical protein
MRDIRFLLKPWYANSRALIIGIDKYQDVSPLSYAVSDAEAVRDSLIKDLGFSDANIVCLLDANATRQNIQKSFLGFNSEAVQLDDRIFVFFAGHGHTVTGFRGEIGYLVPYDAKVGDLSTFIRWDELTGNSELIRAKHMLFIMDACYGGLALTRNLHPGSVRFLKDMTLRYSRQVLTAGKADEVVADSGGPLPDHSVFTGHLLEGLRGAAANAQGILTASGLMAYVYAKVANDKNSNQTPHYGYFDGDGDFILSAPQLLSKAIDEKEDNDQSYVVPYIEEEPTRDSIPNKVAKIKRLLSDESLTIELHDILIQEVQHFLSESTDDHFQIHRPYSLEELIARVSKYESISLDLCSLEACIAYWAKPSHKQILQKVLARSTDRLEGQSGLVVWIYLRWYPIIMQVYSAGIAAIAGGRYDSLANIFFTKVISSENTNKQAFLVESISKAISELSSEKLFKQLPGHEQNYTPMSEYLFKLLQPILDDILFIGKGYDDAFDEFEVLLALVMADQMKQRDGRAWGPIGRFGYKGRHGGGGPLVRIIEEARTQGKEWPPFKEGLFGGDLERFNLIADEYVRVISGLSWY